MNDQTGQAWLDAAAEIERQDEKWGEQNHPSFVSDDLVDRWRSYKVRPAGQAKMITEIRFNDGRGTWADIAVEEIAEAFEEPEGSDDLYTELIQTAAVFLQWAGSVKRNAPKVAA